MEMLLKEHGVTPAPSRDPTPAETGLSQGRTPSSFSSDTSAGLGPSQLHGLLRFTLMPGTATSPSPLPDTGAAMPWSRGTNAASLSSPRGIFLIFHCLKQRTYKQGPAGHEKCDLSCSGKRDATAQLKRSAQVSLEQSGSSGWVFCPPSAGVCVCVRVCPGSGLRLGSSHTFYLD